MARQVKTLCFVKGSKAGTEESPNADADDDELEFGDMDALWASALSEAEAITSEDAVSSRPKSGIAKKPRGNKTQNADIEDSDDSYDDPPSLVATLRVQRQR